MNHYFIGKILNIPDSKKLNSGQTFISRNIKVAPTGKIFKFNTKFAYLGYMDHQTFLELQNKISNVLEALSEKFGPQTCKYTKYDITGLKTTKKSISILYSCNNINNVIVPYLRSYINEITGDTSDFKPHVSLLRVDASDIKEVLKEDNTGKNILEKVFLPKENTLLIDSIDIMRGIPKIKRSGTPSRLDDMDIEFVSKYSLNGKL